MSNYFKTIDNYIYFYQLNDGEGEFVLLPQYPDEIQDQMSSNFTSDNPLSRSAPTYSYSHSGPRHMSFTFTLHRDMFDDINADNSTLNVEIGDDYVDALIKKLTAMALPGYNSTTKMVNPPMAAVRIGNDIFIKGVINGQVSVKYKKPLLDGDKYAVVEVSFQIYEADPYDADTVAKIGGFRGLTNTLRSKIYKGGVN